MTDSPTDAGLRLLVQQMRQASDDGLYFAALVLALTLPDMCAALAADDGRASGAKYRAWVVQHLPSAEEDAARIYELRCSLLHQGSAQSQVPGRVRLAFVEPSPGAPQVHRLTTEIDGEAVGWMSVPMFVDEIGEAVERWFDAYGTSRVVERNIERFVLRRPEGLPPHASGGAVIA